MKTMAMVQDGVVQNIALWDGVSTWSPAGYILVDITNLTQFIDLGYTYDGTNFSAPSPSTPSLEDQAQAYIDFGTDLYKQITQQVWAANELAASQGNPLSVQQLETLLSESDTLQKALETGSLSTALYVISQLVAAFPQYASIGSMASNAVISFTTANPLS
jgi:hypothetical protein